MNERMLNWKLSKMKREDLKFRYCDALMNLFEEHKHLHKIPNLKKECLAWSTSLESNPVYGFGSCLPSAVIIRMANLGESEREEYKADKHFRRSESDNIALHHSNQLTRTLYQYFLPLFFFFLSFNSIRSSPLYFHSHSDEIRSIRGYPRGVEATNYQKG